MGFVRSLLIKKTDRSVQVVLTDRYRRAINFLHPAGSAGSEASTQGFSCCSLTVEENKNESDRNPTGCTLASHCRNH